MPQRKRWHGKGLPAMEFWQRRLSVHLQREVITARRPDHSTRAASGRRRAGRREAVARRKAEQRVEQQDSPVQRGSRLTCRWPRHKRPRRDSSTKKGELLRSVCAKGRTQSERHKIIEQAVPFSIAWLQEQVLDTKAVVTGKSFRDKRGTRWRGAADAGRRRPVRVWGDPRRRCEASCAARRPGQEQQHGEDNEAELTDQV
jgi:hypothetical protein